MQSGSRQGPQTLKYESENCNKLHTLSTSDGRKKMKHKQMSITRATGTYGSGRQGFRGREQGAGGEAEWLK